ncbi:APC family permease [Sulfoacidibacillus ferrooxidans]|uniref:Aspartate-proton symporter n=1 Tax=Sulfoacidibacillus ferrooxidans TaxID=2005001 RepID=A0A9X1V6X2_9BACL|nr:APC family permease [Sulfoacidibacillus ferrooxidans]MCI0182134.1 Aspartate-proton symporter [Sulfoacidibacillus ferrooxidans]
MDQSKLKRSLGLLDLTMVGLGGIIGSGWLLGSQQAAKDAGPAAILAWIIGAIAVILLGLVYSELGARMPESGGIVKYPNYSHGSLASYLMGFAAIIAYSTVPPVEAQAVVSYAGGYMPAGLLFQASGSPTAVGWMIEVVLLVLFFMLNYFGVQFFARVNTIVTFLKFVMPSVTIILLLIGAHHSNFSSHGFMPYGVHGIFTAVATSGVVFAYLGFRQISALAGEARNPQKDIGRAIVTSILLATVIYTLLQFSFVGGVDPRALAHGWGALQYNAPFVQLVTLMGFGWFSFFLYADALISPTGTGNVYFASSSRVTMAMSENRYWWQIFGQVHERSGVPRKALWLALVLGILWTAPFPTWSRLVGFISGATVLTYVIGPVSAMVFRKTATDFASPFTVRGLPIIAMLAFMVGTLIIYWTGWSNVWPLIVMEVLGLVVYAYFVPRVSFLRKSFLRDVKSGIWLVIYLLFILMISYVGSFGGQNLIPYPVDTIVVAAVSLLFFFWGVKSGYPTAALDEARQWYQKKAGSTDA